MISFIAVQGDVLVDDRKQQQSYLAHLGTSFSPDCDCLVVTTENSRATLKGEAGTIDLPPSTWMRIRGGRSWWASHSERFGPNLKVFFGRIWALVARDRPDELESANGSIGVRG